MFDTLLRHFALPMGAKAEVIRPREESSGCPLVSLVIPCFNYGRYLRQCLDTILNQQGVSVDVIVIDDASTDGSDQIVRQLGAEDSRVRTICHKENQGLLATCREAIAHVRGDYIVIISADDLLTPGSLARAMSLMKEYPSVGLVYGAIIPFSGDDIPPARTTARSWVIWRGYDWLMEVCKYIENVIVSNGAVIRTSVLRDVDIYRVNALHTADFHGWLQIATASDVGYLAGADQGYYRIHDNNLHLSFSTLEDFSQRLTVFDSIFCNGSSLLKYPDSMRDMAHCGIARRALSQAMRDTAYRAIERTTLRRATKLFVRGFVGDESVDDYTKFALRAWPDAARLREWRTLHKMTKTGGPPRLDPLLIACMAMRKIETRYRFWRRRCVGV